MGILTLDLMHRLSRIELATEIAHEDEQSPCAWISLKMSLHSGHISDTSNSSGSSALISLKMRVTLTVKKSKQ
jgi:hypothetical protein